eukprot:scaffold20473_cov19-Tisochrysis_lutea.AAC.1
MLRFKHQKVQGMQDCKLAQNCVLVWKKYTAQSTRGNIKIDSAPPRKGASSTGLALPGGVCPCLKLSLAAPLSSLPREKRGKGSASQIQLSTTKLSSQRSDATMAATHPSAQHPEARTKCTKLLSIDTSALRRLMQQRIQPHTLSCAPEKPKQCGRPLALFVLLESISYSA